MVTKRERCASVHMLPAQHVDRPVEPLPNVITRFPGIPLYVFRFPRRSLTAYHGVHVFVVEKINIVWIVWITTGSPTRISLFAAFFSLLGVKRLLLLHLSRFFQQPMLVPKIVRVSMVRQQNPQDQQCEEARCCDSFTSIIDTATRSKCDASVRCKV